MGHTLINLGLFYLVRTTLSRSALSLYTFLVSFGNIFQNIDIYASKSITTIVLKSDRS